MPLLSELLSENSPKEVRLTNELTRESIFSLDCIRIVGFKSTSLRRRVSGDALRMFDFSNLVGAFLSTLLFVSKGLETII